MEFVDEAVDGAIGRGSKVGRVEHTGDRVLVAEQLLLATLELLLGRAQFARHFADLGLQQLLVKKLLQDLFFKYIS